MRARLGLFVAALISGAAFILPLARPAESSATSLPYYDSRDFTPRWSKVAHRVAPFELLDQENRRFTAKDLEGKIHVASFLFASCPGLCPTLVQRLKPVQAALQGRNDVVMVSYTVTPLTDTPSVLAEFGKLRGIDPRTWRLATGELSEIRKLIADSYFADDRRDPGPAVGPGRLLHTEKVLLVDGEGRLRGIYNGTHAFELERLIADVEALRGEKGQ